MSLAALIRKRDPGEPANDNPANPAKDGSENGETLARLATLALANSVEHEPVPSAQSLELEPLTDQDSKSRRQRVLAMLDERPGTKYAALIDDNVDQAAVILALAIRGVGTCEMRVPREKWDPFPMLDLINRHGATVH